MASESTQPGDMAVAPGAAKSAPGLTRKAMWAILGVVLAADAMDLLDSTLTNIAAPDHQQGHRRRREPHQVAWIQIRLAMGVLPVLGGLLGTSSASAASS